MIFFKNHAEDEGGRLVTDLFLFFKEALYGKRKMVCSLVSIYFDSQQLGIQ